MTIPAAFADVVRIWATTPRAIRWSREGAGVLVGVALRRVPGSFVCLLLATRLGRRMPRHRAALADSRAAGLGLWSPVTGLCGASRSLPAALISVIFGPTPVVTGVMAEAWLGDGGVPGECLLGRADPGADRRAGDDERRSAGCGAALRFSLDAV